jgi:putative MATE family efflux protein
VPPVPHLLQLPPDRALWAVAWPVAVTGWIRTGYLLTNAWFVGRLGDDALAALGGASFGWWITMLLAELPAVGVHARVARHAGGGEHERVVHTLVQGLWVGLGVAALMLLLRGLVPVYLMGVGFAPGSPTFEGGEAFLDAALLTGTALVVHSVVGGVFRGLGETRAALAITMLGFLLNAVLDPLLIPWLGIAGASYATAAGNAISAAVGLGWLARRGFRLRWVPPDPDEMRTVAAIGFPVSARGIAFSLVYVLLGRMIVRFGDHQLAGLGVGHRIEGLAYQVCVAFEVATATLVGQNLGAGRPEGARRAADRAAFVCAAIMVPAGALLWVLAPALFGAFADSEAAVQAGTLYLRIQTVCFVFMALESVYGGAFAGSGNTVPPFWIVSLGTLLRVPLAALLAFPLGLGVAGIWWAITLSTIGKGMASAWWYRRHSTSNTTQPWRS